jgi:MYXO-CTERM domain-containing protein
MTRRLASAGLVACALLAARPASAFLIVGTDAAQVPGKETRVLVLREDGRSVVAVQPTVRGPAKPLAVVVPLQGAFVASLRTFPITVFERAEKLTAPRLDEVWELDPCELHPDHQASPGASPTAAASGTSSASAASAPTIDGNYEITLLTAEGAASAPKWLADHGYKLPEGAEKALGDATAKPGTALAIARIDGARLTYEKDEARLPPLGFLVNGADPLPLHLASIGATGPHDVVLDVLSAGARRVEAANVLNLAVPTNLDVNGDARGNLDGLYRAVVDYALEKTPGAALTEYAWPAASCDRCEPGTAFASEDLLALGVDRLPSAEDGSQREVIIDVPESLSRAPEGPPELKRNILGCYDRTLREMSGLSGEATVEIQTGDGGAVSGAKIKDASAEALGKCVEEAARAVKFDKAGAKDTIKAKFALVSRLYLGQLVLTRLRLRAAKGAGGDLELRTAAAIEGGREEGPTGEAEKKVYFAEHANNFHARYVARHPWSGPIACEDPKRGVWGARPKGAPTGKPAASPPPSASASASGKAAVASAAERALATFLEPGPLPDLQPYAIVFRSADPPKPPPAPPPPAASTSAPAPLPSGTSAPGADGGCGCRAEPAPAGRGPSLAISAIALCFLAFRRRNRS